MAAGGRRRLSSLLRAAAVAAKQDRPLPPIHRGHSLSQPTTEQTLFSSSFESKSGRHSSPHNPCGFTLGLAHFWSSSRHQVPEELHEPAFDFSYYVREYPFFASVCPFQCLASQEIGLVSSLCISNGNSDKQVSTKGDINTHTCSKEKNSSKMHQSFWSSHEVLNWPNAISFGRLLSGPLLGWLIMEGILQPAIVGLIIAGASDWFDGFIARKQGVDSVFGTYLDPLADKVLICCVAFSMAQGGYLPWTLVVLIIARDAVLIGGTLVIRVQSLKWPVGTFEDILNLARGNAQRIEPLYISKVNTAFQLALVAVALLLPAFGIEDSYALIPFLSWCVAFTTCASLMGYGWKLLQQRQ